MNIEIKSEVYTPRRQTYAHVARRLGEDRPASRYDEATYDLQATKHFHFRPLWAPEFEIFDAGRTKVVMEDWYAYNDPRQFYYGTYNMNRQAMSASAERSFETVEKRNLISRVEPDWLEKVRNYLVPLRHYEWAADLNSLRVADWGYGTRVTSAAIFAAGDRLGMAQLLTRIGLVLDDGDDAALVRSKNTWTTAAEWQPLREVVEDSLVVEDWYETFVAMGGKNPGIVFADADLDAAVAGTVRSAFENSGQVCLGTERVYVERPIFDEFVERLTAAAKSMRIGDPQQGDTQLGPLISLEHREKVLGYYQKAVDEGATVVTGGGVPDLGEKYAKGAWVEPTVWTGLADDAAAVNEEIFGPCCHVRPFDTEEEVVRLANDTPYGLAAAVWTRDVSRAHRMGAQLDVGICWVNSWFLRDLRTSFGGMKHSGIGREGGVHSLDFYTEPTNVCIKL